MKNVTQYTVANLVSLSDGCGALLSQLKTFSALNQQRIYVTRDFWAKELGVDVRTLRRWEANIVDKLFLMGYRQPKRNNMLDDYQRFILSFIWILKNERKMTYSQILEFMTTPHGKPFWMSITRSKFAEIQSSYSQSRKAG